MSSSWRAGGVVVDGVRIGYRRSGGDLPTLVVAHGLTDSGACGRRLADALAARHDVVLFDARGHGGSARAAAYSFADHVTDLIGLVEHLDRGPVTALGHSMGGAHVTALAAQRPDLVRGLIVEDPHWPADVEDPEIYDLAGWRARLAANRSRPLPDLIEEGRREHPRWHPEELRPWAEAQLAVDPAVPEWLRSAEEIAAWRERLDAVRCPALLVTGDTEVTVTPRLAEEAVARCPTLTVAPVAAAGHCVRRDRFDPFLRAVGRFLALLPAVTGH